MQISPDHWGDWLNHPLTEAFFAFVKLEADKQKATWLRVSWDGGQADPLMLARLQERAKTLEQLARITPSDIEEGLTNAQR